MGPNSQSSGISDPARSSELLEDVGSTWESQAQADPLWAVLSEPDRIQRQWDIDSFMATGEEHISKSLQTFADLGGRLPDHDLALDFGSGVGRLTQPLARRFAHVIGVDISPTMIAVAQRLNVYPEQVRFVLNQQPDLSFCEDNSVTLVNSHITLQHVPPELAERYIVEFLRIVKPGGGIFFQLPSHYNESFIPSDSDGLLVSEDKRRGIISIRHAPDEIEADQAVMVDVSVTNLSDVPWTQTRFEPLNVGNHWSAVSSGESVRYNDGRERLPGRLFPGETANVSVRVTAPDEPGTYLLEFDVVQEGVGWFEVETVRHAIEVTPSVRVAVVPEPKPETSYYRFADNDFSDLVSAEFFQPPGFQMNGIHRSRVEQILEDAGATLVGAEEWIDAWHSFSYYVQAG